MPLTHSPPAQSTGVALRAARTFRVRLSDLASGRRRQLPFGGLEFVGFVVGLEAGLVGSRETGEVLGGPAQELAEALAVLVVEPGEQLGLDLVPERLDGGGFTLAFLGEL